ncbi:MAG: YetF domain-containing protein [Pseudonocardiaceae bacterium]
MPEWLLDGWLGLAIAAAKAALMYLVALLGLRVAHRRTLAQWTAIDFAAAVAIGAIVGRTAIAGDQSFGVGAAALVTILSAHWIATVGRYNSWIVKLVDHRVRVLVDHGRLRYDQLRLCGLTESELLAQLRRHGVASLSELRYVLYETKGELTIVREPGDESPDPELVRIGLRDAADFP